MRSVTFLFLGGWVATSRPMLTLVIGGIATHRLLSTSVHLFCSSSKIVLAIVFLFHSPTEFCIIMGTTLHRIIHAFPHHLLSFSGEPLPTLSIPGSSSASLSSSLEEPLHHVSLLYAWGMLQCKRCDEEGYRHSNIDEIRCRYGHPRGRAAFSKEVLNKLQQRGTKRVCLIC